jgi:3',5'-cyclic AMP phosphodiesterase CpdA
VFNLREVMANGTVFRWIFLTLLGFFLLSQPAAGSQKDLPPACYAGFGEINPGKNSFLVVGDTQSTSRWEFWRERNQTEREQIATEIAERNPAFVLHLGDLTRRGSSEKHWQEFDRLHQSAREKRIPYFPIPGNHELYGNDAKALENYFRRFPHLEEKRWYSFSWKNVALIMTDSNFSSLTEEENERQVKWYRAEMERFEEETGIDHVIACSHEPPFTNSRVVGPNKKVQKQFAEPFLRYRKTRFFLSGHSHSYERFPVQDKMFVASGGGGGPRHKVSTDPRKRSFQDFFDGLELRFFHFCEIELQEKGLLFRVWRLEPDGTLTLADSSALPEH